MYDFILYALHSVYYYRQMELTTLWFIEKIIRNMGRGWNWLEMNKSMKNRKKQNYISKEILPPKKKKIKKTN